MIPASSMNIFFGPQSQLMHELLVEESICIKGSTSHIFGGLKLSEDVDLSFRILRTLYGLDEDLRLQSLQAPVHRSLMKIGAVSNGACPNPLATGGLDVRVD